MKRKVEVVKVICRLVVLPLVMLALWCIIFEASEVSKIFHNFYTKTGWKFWTAVVVSFSFWGYNLTAEKKELPKRILRVLLLPWVCLFMWLIVFEFTDVSAIFVSFYTKLTWKFVVALVTTSVTWGLTLGSYIKKRKKE